MIGYSGFMATHIVFPGEIERTIFIRTVPFFLLVLLIIRNKRYAALWAILSAYFVSIAFVFLDFPFLKNLPIHAARWCSSLFIFTSIAVGGAIGALCEKLELKPQRNIVFFLLILPVAVMCLVYNYPKKDLGLYRNWESDRFYEVTDYIKSTSGDNDTINIETTFQRSSNLVNATLGKDGVQTNFINLRESSISSLFRMPLNNSLSAEYDTWGVTSYLSSDKAFIDQDMETRMKRALFMGNDRFLATSPQSTSEMASSSLVALEKDFGAWKLYRAKEAIETAHIPQKEPILLYADVNFKDRDIDEYDYARFNEELYFQDRRDIIFAAPPSIYLDDETAPFEVMVVTSYQYHDMDKAFLALSSFAEKHHLFLLESDDALYARLKNLDMKNIHTFWKLRANDADPNPLRKQMEGLFDTFSSYDTNAGGAALGIGTSYEKNKIAVTLEPLEKEVPIVIKTSYYPSWKNSNGSPVYLASPTFMLTYAKEDFILTFETPLSVYVGYTLSAMTLVIAIALFYRDKKRS